MSRINVVRVHDRVQEGYVRFRIDRQSPLGNPYVIGVHGDREQVISEFSTWFSSTMEIAAIEGREFLNERQRQALAYYERILQSAVEGKLIELGCHCSPLACHGHVIKQWLKNELVNR